MGWIDAARRIVENKGAEVQLPDGSWTTDWPEVFDFDVEGLGYPPPGVATNREPEGVMLDLYTASMLTQVYDALGPANRYRFGEMDLVRAVDVGWKLVAKAAS